MQETSREELLSTILFSMENMELIKFFVTNGVDVNAKNDYGFRILDLLSNNLYIIGCTDEEGRKEIRKKMMLEVLLLGS